jgi:tRNA dimethylallyltransferase
MVHDIIQEIHSRNNLPLLVGGTGQYIQAIVEGWQIPAIKPDQDLREAIQQWSDEIGVDGLRSRLSVLDPAAVERIDGPNLRRYIRAFEVIFTSGKKFSDQRARQITPYQILQIGIIRPREDLYNRIDNRISDMLEKGLVQEVQSLLDAGYSPNLSSMSAIGYQQIISHLMGEISLDEAIRQIKSKTRKYVRQQANWFQESDPSIIWFSATTNPTENIVDHILKFVS